MTIVTVPDAFRPNRIDWRLHRVATVNRALYTGRRSVMAQPWHGRWSAEVEFAPLTDAQAAEMRAFLAKLKGQVNRFRMEATASAQHSHGVADGVVFGDALAGASSLSIVWDATAPNLPAGSMLTISDQLVILTEAMVTSGGGADIRIVQIEPALRAAAPNGTAVRIRRPTALVALTSPETGWGIDLGPIHSFALSVEEAF